MFVPVTSAWYPLLHNVYMYGMLGLGTLYVAYDTQGMIAEYEMGQDDHIKHAVDLFLNFKDHLLAGAEDHGRRAATTRRRRQRGGVSRASSRAPFRAGRGGVEPASAPHA